MSSPDVWTAVIHPHCRCQWRPETPDGGAWRTARNPDCPVHAWEDHPTLVNWPDDDGARQ